MKNLITGIIIGLVVIAMLISSCRPHDDSDRADGKRSGMNIRTDYKTGVQYLETSRGGITPRLHPDGSLVVAPIQQLEQSTTP